MTYSHPGFRGLIGVARADITPPVGIYARNWGAAAQDVAEGIHRPLEVKVLTLQSSDSAPLILASLDLGWWKTSAAEWLVRGVLMEELGMDESRVLVNLSHTHAGPIVCPEDADLPGGEFIAPYLQQVRAALLRATQNALNAAQRGVLEWSTGWCDLARDRDLPDPQKPRIVCGFNPDADSDGTLLVGRVCNENQKTLAVLTNYACHPTTLAWQNSLISPDWCGAFHELVEKHTDAVSIFLQGASGQLQPKEAFVGDLEIAEAHGRQLGYAVLSVLEGMLPPCKQLEYSGTIESGAPLAMWERVEYSPSQTLSAQQVVVDLPLKDLPSVEEIERELNACQDRTMRERLTRKLRVRELVGNGKSCPLTVWLWQVGDTIFVAHREESYSHLQTELRRRFAGKTIVVMNLTNGSCGYLPPQALYEEDVYQVWQSPYERGGLEKVIEETTNALINL
jgi:hypothetical protein